MELTENRLQELIAESATDHNKIDMLNTYAYDNRNKAPVQSLQIAEKTYTISESVSYLKGKADSLLVTGFCKMHAGDHDVAYKTLWECLEYYRELNDEAGIANAQYTIGIVHIRIGNFEEAVNVLHNCLSFREKQNDKAGMASCFFQLSYVNRHFNDKEGARENIFRSLEIRKEINDLPGLGASLMLLGEHYIQENDLVKAREALEESLRIRKELGEKLGYFASLLRYTELYLLEKKFDEARKFIAEGLEMAKQENVTFGVIRFLQIYAKIEFALGNCDEAKSKLFEALESAEKFSFKSIAYELYESIAELYKHEKDFEKALDYFEKFVKAKQEVINFQSTSRLKSQQLINQIDSARREAELERTKNDQLQEAYSIIEEKNQDITDSIRYAKRIQNGFLPGEDDLNELLGEYFVLYKPKDIVSGDFYWARPVTTTRNGEQNNKMVIVAAVDCTGHGVPGAFMSILGNMLINQTIRHPGINSPAEALNYLNQELPKNMKAQNRDEVIRDGMDISMVAIDKQNMKLFFAAANNPVYIVRNKELIELKADKQAISGSHDIPKCDFTNHTFSLEKNDHIYLFTDGFADQFGGPKGKKFKYKQFQEKLVELNQLAMKEQGEKLEMIFEDWKGNLGQVDDVLVIGIRI